MTSAPGRRSRWRPAAVLTALFLALTAWVGWVGSLPAEERALMELTDAVGTSLDDPMVLVGALTDSVPLVGVAAVGAVLLVRAGRDGDALFLALAVAVVIAANPVLKEVVGRPRPTVRPSPETLSTLSFPSGHAAGTAALVGAFVLTARRRRGAVMVLGGLVVAIVAFSRLVIGAHYPSDILGGWLWVGAWITALRAGTNR